MSLVTVGVVILLMFSMYSIGQQSIAKIKLQNTADAAAYSAAVAQARDYNFSAYTTRAMVANQVAVAQFVGLASWGRNYKDTYHGSFTWIPDLLMGLGASPLRALWQIPWNVHSPLSSGMSSFLDGFGKLGVNIVDIIIDALGTAQLIYHYGTALTVAQTLGMDVFGSDGLLTRVFGDNAFTDNALTNMLTLNPAYNVIKANDPDARLSMPGLVAASIGLIMSMRFVENKDPNTAKQDGEKADRFAQVAVDSLDQFSNNRSTRNGWYSGAPEVFYVTPNPFLIDPTVFVPFVGGAFSMWLWHRGGTELKKVGDKKMTWSAMDVTGFTGLGILWLMWPFPPIPFFVPIPIPFVPFGSGAAQAGDASNLSPNNNFGKSYDDAYGGVYSGVNTAAGAALQQGRGAGSSLGSLPLSKGGLRKYVDVSQSVIKETDQDDDGFSPAPALIVEVEKPGSKIADSNSFGGDEFQLTRGTQSGWMRALSKSQVYFARPSKLWARGDGKIELGSLYNPYWQPRLVDNSFVERYLSMTYHLQ